MNYFNFSCIEGAKLIHRMTTCKYFFIIFDNFGDLAIIKFF